MTVLTVSPGLLGHLFDPSREACDSLPDVPCARPHAGAQDSGVTSEQAPGAVLVLVGDSSGDLTPCSYFCAQWGIGGREGASLSRERAEGLASDPATVLGLPCSLCMRRPASG